jgi:histidinol phosphatase-like enzyme
MFLLLSFFTDTVEVLEEFLIQIKKKEDKLISRKPKPPMGFMDLGI